MKMNVKCKFHGTYIQAHKQKNHMTCLRIIKNSLFIYRVTKKTNNSVECEFVKK